MATLLDQIMQGTEGAAQPFGLPDPDESRLIDSPFGMGAHEADTLARRVAEDHRRARQSRRKRDLTAEKYAIHLDGEGLSQWADIVDDQYVAVPPHLLFSLRLQRNLLRPMTENLIAYHTQQQYVVVAESGRDKESRDKARLDTLFANHLITTQDMNGLVAEALHQGAAYGHGIIHAQWRDDLASDPYEPLYAQNLTEQQRDALRPGFVDLWVGDPWDTTYNEGATRRSVQTMRYGRVMPAALVRMAFGHIPGIEELRGRTDLPASSRFQRTVRKWNLHGQGGATSVIGGHGREHEEMIALVCQEIAPGTDPDHPDGALIVVALNDQSDTDRSSGSIGQAKLLHYSPLPGKRFSGTRYYTGFRGDDITGKPYLSDLDDLQTQLNQLVTMRANFLRKFAHPAMFARAGSLEDDTVVHDDDAIVYFTGENPPQFVQQPQGALSLYDKAIGETLEQMFRIGGWQAASRGESYAGDAAAKVVALAKADDTIFGPMNRGLQQSIIETLQTGHALAKKYMTVPVLLQITGTEWGYIADPWLRQDQLSDRPPRYRITSSFGATPESRAEQLMAIVEKKGADGKPLLNTATFWRLWPDQSLRPPEDDAQANRETRAQAINYKLEKAVRQAREQYAEQMDDEQVQQQILAQIHQQVGTAYPLLRTENPQYAIEVLDQLVHDVYQDPLVRQLAQWRQEMFFQWIQQQQAAQQQQAGEQPGQPQQAGPQRGASQRDLGRPHAAAGTSTSRAMANASQTVQELTRSAGQGDM
jgi:hypothetical protein